MKKNFLYYNISPQNYKVHCFKIITYYFIIYLKFDVKHEDKCLSLKSFITKEIWLLNLFVILFIIPMLFISNLYIIPSQFTLIVEILYQNY